MNDPLRRLKFLPWRSLVQVAALAIGIAAILDFLLGLGYAASPLLRSSLSSPFAPLLVAAAGVGIGALAVYLLERFYRQVVINPGILWGLILCLALGLVVKSLLRLPGVLVGLDEIQLITVVVGVFWKGRAYWR